MIRRLVLIRVFAPGLLAAILSACTATAMPAPTDALPTVGQATTAASTATEIVPVDTITIPTPAPEPTSTPDTRLPPEQWQEWPVVPQVTGRAIEIYRTGLGMDLDQHAFSKAGDCQSVKAAFMGYFDLGNYPASLTTNYPELQETIDYFYGHFNTDGQAVRGGFNAASLLSPLWADPQACLPGENPLECELRLTRPIIVFVRMEIWWDGRTPEQYEKLMRRILDTIIEHGAVPVLATKADNVEGDHSLNYATARLAYEYDLPLWNFWAAVQSLPAHGLRTEPPNNDGFHISTAAWSVQSFTALQTLDAIWRGLLASGSNERTGSPTKSVIVPTATLLATPAQEPLPTETPTPGSGPLGGSDRIIFGLASRQGENYQYEGVYLFDLTARTTRQVFGEGVRFQAASADGKYILVSQGDLLFRANVDGAALVHLTDTLFSWGDTSAVWLADGRMVALLQQPDGSAGIGILSADGAVESMLSHSGGMPIRLYPAADTGHVYWETGLCTAPGICNSLGAWVSSVDGSLDQFLAGITSPAINPAGTMLAYTYPVSTIESDLGLSDADGGNPQQVTLPGKLLTTYAWSPTGDVLAVSLADVSDYSGLTTGNRNFTIDPISRAILEYAPSNLLHPRLLWSPDGKYLLRAGTLSTSDGFMIGVELVNLATRQVTDLSESVGQTNPNYLLVTNAAWLPLP